MDNVNPFQQIQDNVFHKEHHEISSIYADMELLQDLKFGALLTFVTLEDELRYIYSKLNEYNDRLDTSIGQYFPALKITDEMITNRMKDPKYTHRICGTSPFTSAYDDFVSYLMGVLRHNRILGKQRMFTVTINVSDIAYPADVMSMLKNNLMTAIPDMRFQTTRYNRYEQPVVDFTGHDTFFLYEMHKLLMDGSPMAIPFAQNGSFFGKEIFSPPYIDKTVHKDPVAYDNILVSTEYGLNIYCDFKYVQANLTTLEATNG